MCSLMARVESKHEHSSRSSLEAQVYRSLGLTLGEEHEKTFLNRIWEV